MIHEIVLQWSKLGSDLSPSSGEPLELLHEKSDSGLVFAVDLNHVVDIIWLRVQLHCVKAKQIAGLTLILDVLWALYVEFLEALVSFHLKVFGLVVEVPDCANISINLLINLLQICDILSRLVLFPSRLDDLDLVLKARSEALYILIQDLQLLVPAQELLVGVPRDDCLLKFFHEAFALLNPSNGVIGFFFHLLNLLDAVRFQDLLIEVIYDIES